MIVLLKVSLLCVHVHVRMSRLMAGREDGESPKVCVCVCVCVCAKLSVSFPLSPHPPSTSLREDVAALPALLVPEPLSGELKVCPSSLLFFLSFPLYLLPSLHPSLSPSLLPSLSVSLSLLASLSVSISPSISLCLPLSCRHFRTCLVHGVSSSPLELSLPFPPSLQVTLLLFGKPLTPSPLPPPSLFPPLPLLLLPPLSPPSLFLPPSLTPSPLSYSLLSSLLFPCVLPSLPLSLSLSLSLSVFLYRTGHVI